MYTTTVETDLEATMRDGTVLRADVYRPDVDGTFPIILERTPYDKSRDQYRDKGPKLAERGFLFVVQDVRGRYRSDGEFMPGFYSSDHMDDVDGYDTVEWAATLPWTTGAVGTTGGSYNGWTQLELAHMQPPHLKAIMPQLICANLLDREKSGVLRLGRVLWWSINTLAPDQRVRDDVPIGSRTQDEAEEFFVSRDRSKWYWYLPLRDIPDDTMHGIGRHWRKWLDDHATDHFGFEAKHRYMDVPTLTQTGWYDQQIMAVKNFTGLKENAATELARQNQYLIIGPWTHDAVEWPTKLGDIDFGEDAHLDYFEITSQWYRRWLNDEVNAIADWPKVRIFVMGDNKWRAEDDWPLARTRYTKYFLHSGGHADSASGDGILSQEAPGDEPTDEYVYDPRDSVMTLYTPSGQHEPLDQRALDERLDILRFSTPPLQRKVEVTGHIVVKLFAASTARDTDFVAKLLDIWPNGYAQELCYGIVRARYRDSFENPTLIEQGKVYEYDIEVNPTSNVFKPGHRIRLDISSSDFPNFDRNHNTGGNDYVDATLISARQTVSHDADRPSHVVLPIIPR
jgi:hypothetical protein